MLPASKYVARFAQLKIQTQHQVSLQSKSLYKFDLNWTNLRIHYARRFRNGLRYRSIFVQKMLPPIMSKTPSDERLEGRMKRITRALRSDFGQKYSHSRLQQVLSFPITLQSCLNALLGPFLLPVSAASMSLIPLDDPQKGFQGRNYNMIFLAICMSGLLAVMLDTRLVSMIPTTRLDLKKRWGCALALVLTTVISDMMIWTFIVFPFPFCTL